MSPKRWWLLRNQHPSLSLLLLTMSRVMVTITSNRNGCSESMNFGMIIGVWFLDNNRSAKGRNGSDDQPLHIVSKVPILFSILFYTHRPSEQNSNDREITPTTLPIMIQPHISRSFLLSIPNSSSASPMSSMPKAVSLYSHFCYDNSDSRVLYRAGPLRDA